MPAVYRRISLKTPHPQPIALERTSAAIAVQLQLSVRTRTGMPARPVDHGIWELIILDPAPRPAADRTHPVGCRQWLTSSREERRRQGALSLQRQRCPSMWFSLLYRVNHISHSRNCEPPNRLAGPLSTNLTIPILFDETFRVCSGPHGPELLQGIVPMNIPEFSAEVDSVTESDWSELLGRFADANIYQSWSYGAIRWGRQNLSHLILKRNGEVAGIAQLRIVRPGNMKMGMGYLRWGPLCHPRGTSLDSEVVKAMAAALREEYAKKRRLYLEILPNAFLGSSRAEVFQSAFSEYAGKDGLAPGEYRTLLVNIQPPLEEIRKKLDKKWRNQLNAAEKNNLSVIEGEGIKEYRYFSEIYTEMWERKKFKTTVSVEEFGRIQESLPENQRMKVLICEHEGKPLAGVVCSAVGETASYLLGATNLDGMKLKGAYLLHWTMIRWLKERCVRYYDLGGIDPETNPGVYHFKQGFSGVDSSHMSPLTTCDNSLSLALVKTGQVLRDGLRRFQMRFGHA